MPSRIMFFIGILLFEVFLRPIPALAADARCLRLTLNVDESNPVTPFYDYNPSTKNLTSFSLFNTITWYDESPDGRWVALKLNGDEKGLEFVRFVDRITQRFIDYTLEDMFSSYMSQGGRLMDSGWSPDGQFYALPVISFANNVEEGWLLLFGRDHTLTAQIPFHERGGYALWSWMPDSKRLVMAQPDPSEIGSEKIHYTVQIASVSKTVIEAPLPEPTYFAPYLSVSPDERFILAADPAALFVIDASTGDVVTVAQNVAAQTRLDVAWSPDSKYILYQIPTESTDSYRVDVLRYSIATQESEVVLENAGIPYAPTSYTALNVPISDQGKLLVSQQSDDAIHFYLVEAQSGEVDEIAQVPVNDLSLNAMSEWSPIGDVVWLIADTISFVRPETTTQATLPEGTKLVSMYNTLLGRWSQNGEWISVLVQNSDSTFGLTVINTKTGKLRTIPMETIPEYAYYVIMSNTGVILLADHSILSLVSEDGSLTQLTDSLEWMTGLEYGNKGAVWSPDGTKIALIEPSLENSVLSILKIFQSNGTLISTVDVPVSSSSITSLNWVPCV